MSNQLLSRCGYRCDLCLAYQENIDKKDQRKELSEGWKKCFGLNIPLQDIYCEGCLTKGNPKLIDHKCPVRPCVLEKGFDNCSQCNDYPCDLFRQRQVIFDNVIQIKEGITQRDRELFILPYENKVRLDKLRKVFLENTETGDK